MTDPATKLHPSGAPLSFEDAAPATEPGSFVLLFRPLLHLGRAFAFPCDPHGRVDMDAMSGPARNNYLYARAMMGRELAFPTVHAERR